jgi:hypothetical protein
MEPGVWIREHVVKVTGFIAREPADGAEPTQNTDVYLAYDEHNLYAVFVCWDKEPDKIHARMTRREDILSDDSAETRSPGTSLQLGAATSMMAASFSSRLPIYSDFEEVENVELLLATQRRYR